MSYQHDPLGNREWSAMQSARRFQADLRHVEEATGKVHRLSDTAQCGSDPRSSRQRAEAAITKAKDVPKLPYGHYASLDSVGSDGCKATTEEVRRG